MKFLKSILLIGLLAVIISCSDNNSKTEMNLFIGTYTGTGSDGIYQAVFDESTGKISTPNLVAKLENPSYLAVNNDRKYMYAVSENEKGRLAAWKIEGDTALTVINEVSTNGAHPCHVDVYNGQVAFANYSSGNGGVFQTNEEGALKKGLSEFQHYGSGADAERQGSPHAHFSKFSKDGRFLYAVDLGIDQVVAYPVDNGKIGAATTALILEPGSGPRHLEFHPSEDVVFIISELSNTITSASVDTKTGKFNKIGRVSTLPGDFAGKSYCADIHISGDGRFLYASNRGHHSISIFSVGEDGVLELLTTEPVRGDWPRNFTLSPNGRYLLVANQNSNNIVVFERDEQTGLLAYTGKEAELSKPVCLKFY